MRRILAIETDFRRRQTLTSLVREHVKASLELVTSVRAAIASIEERTPDLILLPTLMAPTEEAELLAYMKRLDSAPYVQMLTVPAFDVPTCAPAETRRWTLGQALNRRPGSPAVRYDLDLIAAPITAGLERARELRLAYAATLSYNEAMSQRSTVETSLVPIGSAGHGLLQASGARLDPSLLDAYRREERRVASRLGRGDVPWLSGIKVSWGPELDLINISNTGVLVETGVKFAPGSTANLQLSGGETNLVVPVRFIRSDVARIDGLGVRYRAAAAFAKEVDIERRGRDATAGKQSEGLAALFGAVVSAARDEPAHARFAQGLRQLVGALDVRISAGPAGSSAGRSTLFFEVPGDDRSRTTLRVMFDRNHDVTDAEFRVLKAAAWLTAAVLELEKPVKLPVEPAAPRALIGAPVG